MTSGEDALLTEGDYWRKGRTRCMSCRLIVWPHQPALWATVSASRVRVLHALCADLKDSADPSIDCRQALIRAARAYESQLRFSSTVLSPSSRLAHTLRLACHTELIEMNYRGKTRYGWRLLYEGRIVAEAGQWNLGRRNEGGARRAALAAMREYAADWRRRAGLKE